MNWNNTQICRWFLLKEKWTPIMAFYLPQIVWPLKSCHFYALILENLISPFYKMTRFELNTPGEAQPVLNTAWGITPVLMLFVHPYLKPNILLAHFLAVMKQILSQNLKHTSTHPSHLAWPLLLSSKICVVTIRSLMENNDNAITIIITNPELTAKELN